jgi:ParB-like chromosome segregation protein Spo0J
MPDWTRTRLPLWRIDLQTVPNARQRPEPPERWAAFVESIRVLGVLHPPGIGNWATGDRHPLVFGFRRVRALLQLYGPEHVELFSCIATTADALMVQTAENVGRSDLAPWELADRLSDLVTAGRDLAQLAGAIGMSSSHAANLVRMRRNLHPDLWRLWTQEAAPLERFRALAALPSTHQLAAWQDWIEEPTGQQRRSTRRHAQALLADVNDLEGREGSTAYSTGAGDALRAVLFGRRLELDHGRNTKARRKARRNVRPMPATVGSLAAGDDPMASDPALRRVPPGA